MSRTVPGNVQIYHSKMPSRTAEKRRTTLRMSLLVDQTSYALRSASRHRRCTKHDLKKQGVCAYKKGDTGMKWI